MINVTIVVVFATLHVLALIGLFLIKNISVYTIILQIIWYVLGTLATTAGYHRLWCHRSYEASSFLEWLFMFFGSSTGQGHAIKWCQTHRTHHRNEDKMTDPYSISKGFLFAHIGWMIQYYDEETKKEVDSTDVADLTSKPVLQIQKRNIILLWIVMSFIVPILIAKLWGETVTNTFFSSTIRTVLLWHGIWCVNSLAHMYGDRPYNGDIEPSENAFVSLVTLGEGWHNFHHTYPKDYRASEPGKYNPTTFFIDAMDYLGLVKNKHAACDKTVHVRGVGKFNKANYCVST